LSTSRLFYDPNYVEKADELAYAFARIESHYFANGGFFETEQQILEDVPKIKDIPAVIVQGRYDVVCPMVSAWELKKRYEKAELKVVPDAGHSCVEPGIISELVIATDKKRNL